MANKHSDLNSLFTDIADAIREKTGSTGTIVADEFPEAISSMKTGFEYNNDKITEIADYAFYNNDDLISVNCPNLVAIGAEAFYDCDNLKSITLGDSVTSIGDGAFYNTAYYNNENNWYNGVLYIGEYLIDAKLTISGEYTIKDGTLCICHSAFEDCSLLTSVVLPDSVTSIGDDAFYYCKSLTSITISEDNETYQSIDGNLYSKDGKMLIQYAIGKTDTSFIIPDSVESIGYEAFSWCTSLTSVEIPDSVTSIGEDAFRRCNSLASVEIPDSVTSIGYDAFAGCTSLTSVVIGESVTSIGSWAFYDCGSLTRVDIGDIGNWCNITFAGSDSNPLYYAKNLYLNNELVTELVIPDTVTEIKKYAFYNCDSLTSLEIPDSVTSIGERTFSSCKSLTDITFNGTIAQWNAITFGASWNNNTGNYTIHCTDGDIAKA